MESIKDKTEKALIYRIVGINDDQDSCDCCGKTGLKRVVWLEEIETGHVVAFGTTCAARARGWTVKEEKGDETAFEKAEQDRIKAEIHTELWPYDVKNSAAINSAPDPYKNIGQDRSNLKIAVQERMSYIRNHPDVIAYEAKRTELAERYNLPVWQVR